MHGNKADNLKQASQSEHRISFIFPMSTASDVLKRVSKADIFSVCIALEHPFDEGVTLKTLFKLFTGVVYLSTQLIKPYYLVIPLNPPPPQWCTTSASLETDPPSLLDKWSYNYEQSFFFNIYFYSLGVPMELSYALDEAEEGSIAVNMLPLLLASRNGAKSKDKIDRWGKERKKIYDYNGKDWLGH